MKPVVLVLVVAAVSSGLAIGVIDRSARQTAASDAGVTLTWTNGPTFTVAPSRVAVMDDTVHFVCLDPQCLWLAQKLPDGGWRLHAP